jgi:hypothetical protein
MASTTVEKEGIEDSIRIQWSTTCRHTPGEPGPQKLMVEI